VIEILKYAYGVHASQVTGGPEWLGTKKFDVLADPETEVRPTSDQMKRMVQELVAERFGLRFHHAGKELPVFAITVGKAGPRLTKSSRDEPGGIPAVGFTPPGSLGARNATMADFATFLQRFVLDRPVVDQTGVTGRYDIDLSWTPEELQSGGGSAKADAPPGLFTAIQEQLGLKLNATKALIDVFVVDQVEQPSAN